MRDSTGKAIVGALILLAGSIIFGAGIIASALHKDNFGAIPIIAGIVLGLIGLIGVVVALGSRGPPAAS
jgi:uncharacterized membrane protein